MSFQKGKSGNPKGKPKGATNHITRTVKEQFIEVFNKLQEDLNHPSHLLNFARSNPKEFYPLASKIIPTEISAKIEETVIKVVRE